MSSVTAPRSPRAASNTATAPVKRMTLAEVTNKATRLPNRIILHGPPGIGKTSLGAAFPSPVFLMTRGETGLLTLMHAGQIPPTDHFPKEAENWQDILDAIEELIAGDHKWKTLVIDVLNGAERLCHEAVCQRDFNGDFGERGFMGFQRGYATALGDWRKLLFLLDKLREVKNMSILCLCHTGTGSVRNPMGPDYDCFMPALHKQTWNVTVGWADMVLFAQKEVHVEEKKGHRAKGHSGDRVLLTEGTAAYEAKNRAGLPEEISMGNSGQEAFANLLNAMTKEGAK
jgi:hypothetical protein